MSSRVLVTCLVLLVAASLAGARSAQSASRFSVGVSRTRISTGLGDKFTIRSTVVNHGSKLARGLIAHLNVVGLDPSVYVDPEDWSSHRTIYLETLPASGSTTITWRLQAVSAGAVDVYVAVFPRRATARPPTTGPTVRVTIADKRTLNSGGILPLALGIPAFLALLAFSVRVKRGH
jgi:hypothetical protein